MSKKQLTSQEVLRPKLVPARIRKISTCEYEQFRIYPKVVDKTTGEEVTKVFTVRKLKIHDPTAIGEGAGDYTITLVRRLGEAYYSLKDRGKSERMNRTEAVKWLAMRLPGEETEAVKQLDQLGEYSNG